MFAFDPTKALLHAFVALAFVSCFKHLASASEFPLQIPSFKKDYLSHNKRYNVARQGPPDSWEGKKPLRITNQCSDTVWPAILTQHGVGPSSGGFELSSGDAEDLWVGSTWQGRVWGRTNCTVSGDSASCETGDCFKKLECEFAGDVPATLAEFTLEGGISNQQTFYDISLVDGYNLPMSINYIPAGNTSFIPPNLTNLACIATSGYLEDPANSGLAYSNSTYPVPWEAYITNQQLSDWCPWPLLADPPDKPGDGVYPYPDDKIDRPTFSPCLSACAKTGNDKDCCAGDHDTPETCSPNSYSKLAKAMCPDAYSYAYDDQTSTFIIPSGGGWEVLFCPEGRSTNILRTLGDQLSELAETGNLTEHSMSLITDRDYIEKRSEETSDGTTPRVTVMDGASGMGLLVAVVLSLCLL